MNEPDPREIIDIATLERIEEVLRLRDAADPDPLRTTMIHDLRTIRNMLAHNMARPDESAEEAAALEARLTALLRDLSTLEMTSLGTAEARRVRSAATASRVANILARHEQIRRADPRAKAAVASAASDIALMVRRAAEGDVRAWEHLVDQYAGLIWAITREFKLVEGDAADVAQTTWLRLLEHIDRIEDPARVGSWLAATTRNECLRTLATRKRVVLGHDDVEPHGAIAHEPEIDARLPADERDQVVRDALSRLPRRWQRLLELLMADPPASYAEISDELGLSVGSIGPTRARCLARLRVLLQASGASTDSHAASYALSDSECHQTLAAVGDLVSGRCG